MGSSVLGFLRRRSTMRPFYTSLFRCILRRPTPANLKELGFVPPFESASIPRGSCLGLTRSFCDSPSEGSVNDRQNSAASIKPVSYPVKPKDESSSISTSEEVPESAEPRKMRMQRGFRQQETEGRRFQPEARSWTREDARYVKDAPTIAPVSYPTRVAPLPEDKVPTVEEKKEDEQKMEDKKVVAEDGDARGVALEKESRGIERQLRVRRVARTEEESLPFPTLIKWAKGTTKPLLDLQDAIREVKANAKRNFLETVEAHVQLGVDPRRGDQMVRGAITLPHGTGKVVRVAVFAEGAAADEAKAAGADIVGGDDLIDQIKNGGGKLNFDKCIAVPGFMPRLGKIARILGPRGLMPNPKLGSLTSDVGAAVQEAKRGRIDFKIDKTAIVHVGIGKVNFPDDSLRENIGAFVNALLLAKPVGLKKTSKYAGYVNKFSLCSTMGPVFPVTIQSLSMAADHYNKLLHK